MATNPETRAWHELTEEERGALVKWLRGKPGEPIRFSEERRDPPYDLRKAAADALEGPLWGEKGDTW